MTTTKPQSTGPTSCDYRNKDCAATGVTIGGKWICNNHICEQRQQRWLNANARPSPSAAPVVDDGVRRLTLPELNHLSALLEAERESGSYAGPRDQYYARTERLIKWCNDQIGER